MGVNPAADGITLAESMANSKHGSATRDSRDSSQLRGRKPLTSWLVHLWPIVAVFTIALSAAYYYIYVQKYAIQYVVLLKASR
jgi:hypothetical protein